MVLLVDDQAMIGEAVRRVLLGQPNIEFHYCGSPSRAVEVVEKSDLRSFCKIWSCLVLMGWERGRSIQSLGSTTL